MGALISECRLSTCSPVPIVTSSFGRRAVVVGGANIPKSTNSFSRTAPAFGLLTSSQPVAARHAARSEMGKQEPKSERPTPVHTSLFVDRHPTVARRSRPDVPTRAEETRAEDRAPHTHPSPPPHLRLRRLALHAAAAARMAPDAHPDGGTSIPRRPRDESDADRRSIAGPTADLTRVPTFPPAPSQTRPRVPTSPPPTTH